MTIRGPWAIALVVVLAVSLAANFIVAGFAAARLSGFGPGGALENLVALGIRSYPPEIRRAILGEALSDRSDLRAGLDAIRAAREKMFAAMRAEPFDAAALDQAFAEVRQKTAALQQVGQGIVGRAVAAASPEVRARITAPPGLP